MMIRLFAALGLSVALAWPAAAQTPRTITVGHLSLTRCGENSIYCGRLERKLDPDGIVPGTIEIFFNYIPADDQASPLAGTLAAAEGGPGFPTTDSAAEYLALFRPLMAHRDVVMMDYRGTGRSGAIDCKPLQTAPKLTVENIARCGEQLGATAWLYSAAFAADDMAAVLTALDRGKVDLYGDSYGTWFSQIFAVRHPGQIRSIVLDGAYPVRPVMGESPWQPFYAEQMRRKFDLLCQRSAGCAGIGGSSIDHIRPALEELRAHPFDASAPDADGKMQHFRADPASLALVMFGQSPVLTTARETDAAARAFAAGDRAPLLRLMAEAYATSDSRDPAQDPVAFSEGMAAAVDCSDAEQIFDMTLPPEKRVIQRDNLLAAKEASDPGLYAPFTFAEYRGLPLDYEYIDQCVRWPVPPARFHPHQTLPPDAAYPPIPALVISGELDDVTTPSQGAIAAAQFAHGTHLVVANSFHVNALERAINDCVPNIVRRFIDTLATGDTACAGAVPALPLVSQFVRHAADAAPATPLAGNAADRLSLALAASVIHTAADAIDREESHALPKPSPGLRGGSFLSARTKSGTVLTLKDLRWAEDLAVSGTVELLDSGAPTKARLRFQQPGGPSGTVEAEWSPRAVAGQAMLHGTVAGKKLVASMPVP
jgi:pimeloyl-ACP methyl ester carboxylesterase